MPEVKGTWSGTVDQFSHDIEDSCPVRLVIDEIAGQEFMGTMEWPTFGGCQTRLQGYLEGERMIWSETAYLRGDDVVLYGLYVGRLKADGEIEGDWMDPSHAIHPKGPVYGVPGATFRLRKE